MALWFVTCLQTSYLDFQRFSQIIPGMLKTGNLSRRFSDYARRIVELNYTVKGEFIDIHPSTWIRLSQLEGGLLPRLKSLTISYEKALFSVGKERSLLMIPALLKSRFISSVTVDMPVVGFGDAHGMGPALSIIADYYRTIKVLSLTGTLSSPYVNYIMNMQMLQTVTLKLGDGTNTSEILDALSSLRDLVDITLDINAAIDRSYIFFHLKKLTVFGTLALVSTSLSNILAPELESISVNLWVDNTDRLHTMETDLSPLGFGRYSALKKIFVDWPTRNAQLSPDLEKGILVRNFMKPIMTLYHIEELVLTSLEPVISFSNINILQIATSWPQLKVLRLEHRNSPSSPQPSLASLNSLVRNCPDLMELSLSFEEGNLQHQIKDTVSCHGLSKLDLQHTNIQSHVPVARYLDGLFPYLAQLDLVGQKDRDLLRALIFDLCHPIRKDQEQREEKFKGYQLEDEVY